MGFVTGWETGVNQGFRTGHSPDENLMDTGDTAVDRMLPGYAKLIRGLEETTMVKAEL